MTWNLMHVARTLKDAGGAPVHGNQQSSWDGGGRFDYPNPEHRLPDVSAGPAAARSFTR